MSIFRIRVINRHGHVRSNNISGKRRIGQTVKAVCQILLFLLWKKNLKYIITGYDIVLDRYQYLLYNTKCGNTNLFRTRSATMKRIICLTMMAAMLFCSAFGIKSSAQQNPAKSRTSEIQPVALDASDPDYNPCAVCRESTFILLTIRAFPPANSASCVFRIRRFDFLFL